MTVGNAMEEAMTAFVASNFYVGQRALGREESLLDAGIVDSTGVLELIAYLEETFGIQVEDDEVLPENLDSIANGARSVARKRQGVARSG
jgi:acyl carrier protein